jgi:hypothetical protein
MGTLAAAIWQNRLLAGVVAGIILVVVIWTDGYSRGTEAERAVWQARTAAIRVQRAGAVAVAAAQADIIAQAARDMADLRAELEDAAHADPDADRPALGSDAVRRLQRYR